MKTSFKSRVYRAYIRLKGIKKGLEKEFQKNNFDEKVQVAAEIPENVQRQCTILQHQSPTGRTVWELRKKDTEPKQFIFYIHGGGFVYNITKYDWALLNKIVQSTGYGIVVPDYPLTPKYNYKDVYTMVVPEYEKLLFRVGSKNVVLMGFSAGAGLTLSLAQFAKIKSIGQPAKIIIISPLLDATLSNPEISDIEKVDPYIGIDGLKHALLFYSGGDDLSNYQISPINGPLEGLAPISLFVGTHEVTLPDARKLVALARQQNATIDYYEYPEMYHAWVFLDMPEARSVFNQLIKILH